jgi:O-antigen biosynthesis protein WbqP
MKKISIEKKAAVAMRVLDVMLAGLGLLILWPLLLFLYLVGLIDTGSPVLCQERVGRNLKPFRIIKFRTMSLETPHVGSHLVKNSAITPLGGVLRRTKLDELPQLWNVLRGEMSLVGPRPNLFNQKDLIKARTALGVYLARPGITGLAQIRRIDMSNPDLLARTDAEMLKKLNLYYYFKYIFMTIAGNGVGDCVKSN